MPTEPPVDHGRGHAGHGGAHAHAHPAVRQEDITILQHVGAAEQIPCRILKSGQQRRRHTTTIERCGHMRRQRRHVGIEKVRKGLGSVGGLIAQIAADDRFAALHGTRPI